MVAFSVMCTPHIYQKMSSPTCSDPELQDVLLGEALWGGSDLMKIKLVTRTEVQTEEPPPIKLFEIQTDERSLRKKWATHASPHFYYWMKLFFFQL